MMLDISLTRQYADYMTHTYSPVTPEIISRLAEIVGPENVVTLFESAREMGTYPTSGS